MAYQLNPQVTNLRLTDMKFRPKSQSPVGLSVVLSGFLSLALSFCLILQLVIPSASAEEIKRSKLVIPAPTYDFGTVNQGAEVNHDFVIKNEGNADLVIQRVHAACGCTASAPSQNIVAAGEQAVISVKFDTAGFSGDKLKTVRVYTSDMDSPSSILTLKGTIEPDVMVEPRRVFFDNIVRGSTTIEPIEVVVRVREGSKSTITSVKAFSQYISVTELSSGPKERRLKIAVDSTAPVGELRDRIVIGITGTRQSSINIPVLAVVGGTVMVTPSVVSMGVIEGTEPLERTVKIQSRGGEAVNVTSVTSTHPAISTDLKSGVGKKAHDLTIKVDPSKVTRDLRATVVINTDSKEEPSVSLSVYGTLPPKV